MSRFFASVGAAAVFVACQSCDLGGAVAKFNETKERAYMATMKADLRNLADALVAYRAKHGRFAVGAASNADGTLTSGFPADLTFAPTFNVTVRVDTSDGSWSATASHASTIKTCLIVPGSEPACK